MIARRAAWERREMVKRLLASGAKKAKPFTFRARRPFHPERLFVALTRGQASHCKLAGIAWLASRNDEQATVLHPPSTELGSTSAGLSVVRGSPWWASVDREDWPEGLAEDLLGTALWDEAYGDRQVEIRVSFLQPVQSLPPLHHETIEAELTSCLLTDAELEAGAKAWDKLDDPFLFREENTPFSFAGPPLRSLTCHPCGPPKRQMNAASPRAVVLD